MKNITFFTQVDDRLVSYIPTLPSTTPEEYEIHEEQELRHTRIERELRSHKKWLQDTPETTPGNFIQLDMAGITISFIDLTGANLFKVNFSNTTLYGVCFNGAILDRVIFDNAIIINCSFVSASMKGVSFSGTTLTGSSLINANLSKSTFNKANFNDCELRDSVFTDCRFISFVRHDSSKKEKHKTETLDDYRLPDKRIGYKLGM